MRPVRSTSWISFLGVALAWVAWAVPVLGQAPAATPPDDPSAAPAADLPVPSTPAKTTKLVDLANRYRFTERYPREDGRELPGSLGPYRVGLFEVVKDVIDQPQGAPRRSELTRQAIFIERATEQAGIGGVIGSVRFYERYATRPADPSKLMGATPLDGLSIATRFRSADWPLVGSLNDRKPTDYEFEVVARQMIVPQLNLILPGQAIRLGDSWRVPRRAAQALLGEPGAKGDTLVGKFDELRKEVDGPRLVALVRVTGRITTPTGESAVNAEVQFTFQADTPAKTPLDNVTGRTTEGLLEARGAITEVRMGRTTTGPLPGPGRLKYQTTREVTMRRQLDLGPLGASLPRFPSAPKVNDPNHWLTWLDPSGRFRLNHPQDLLPPERPALAPGEPGSAALVRTLRGGTDLIQVDFVGKALGPDDLKAKLAAKYGKIKVIQGEEAWLPELDWPNRKVYRVEAAVEAPNPTDGPSSRSTRLHFDGYLIQTTQASSLLVIATTDREPVAPFRREVEQILKTIEVDPAIPSSPR